MGIMQTLFGGATSKTRQQTLPGIFGASPESGRLAGKTESLLGSEPELFGMLRQELMSPSFGPTNAGEQDFLSSIMDLTSGRSAMRGLGAPTQQALASSIAPSLMNFRNQRVSNLAQALGLEQGFRGQNISGLLELGGMAMPQNVFTPQMKQEAGIIPALLGGLKSAGEAKAGMAALCWVAEEIYGADDTRTHLARLYANSNDTWFLRQYRKHGKRWAAWLKKHPWVKPIVRPIWDSMVRKGYMMLEKCYGQ